MSRQLAKNVARLAPHLLQRVMRCSDFRNWDFDGGRSSSATNMDQLVCDRILRIALAYLYHRMLNVPHVVDDNSALEKNVS